MTSERQKTFEACGIEWCTQRNYPPCMAEVILFVFGSLLCSLGVKRCLKSWESHEFDQQCGEHASLEIRKRKILQNQGNPSINKLLAMSSGLPGIFVKQCMSTYFEST